MALIKALTRKIRVFCVCFPQIFADEPQIAQKTFGMALIKALTRKIRVFCVCFPQIFAEDFRHGID
jgi:hypothetical protein